MRPFLYAAVSGANQDALIFCVDRHEVIVQNKSYWAFTCRQFPEFIEFDADKDNLVNESLRDHYLKQEGYAREFYLVRLSETKESSQEGWEAAKERCG